MVILRQSFCAGEKELTREEYLRLVSVAEQAGDKHLALLLKTICGTGIRVSELKYIIVEPMLSGEAAVCLKGKHRLILIAGKLRKALREYMRKAGIKYGALFITHSGCHVDSTRAWEKMKFFAATRRVTCEKVFCTTSNAGLLNISSLRAKIWSYFLAL